MYAKLISFLIIQLAPGDPATMRLGSAGEGIRDQALAEQIIKETRALYGLDQPLYVQYGRWLKRIVTLDFGESFKDNQPVWSKIIERLPITIQLNIYSILLIYLVAIPLGIYSATQRNTLGDQMTTVAAFILFAVPTVWAATMALVFICGGDFFYLFPPGGLNSIDYEPGWPWWKKFNDKAWHLFLPVVLLSYGGFAGLSRYMRAGMLEVLGQDYVQVARAKGLLERVVIMKHVLRNSIGPAIVLAARDVGGVVLLQATLTFVQIGGDSIWGTMLSQGRNWVIGPGGSLLRYWWVFLPPTLAVMSFGIAWNMFGDGLSDALEPSSQAGGRGLRFWQMRGKQTQPELAEETVPVQGPSWEPPVVPLGRVGKSQPVDGADPVLALARQDVSRGDLIRALHAYRHLIRHERQVMEILPDLAGLVKAHPHDPELWQTLGDALARAGHQDRAGQSYERARKLRQSNER